MLISREILEPKAERIYEFTFPWLADGETITTVQHTIEDDDGIFAIDQLIIIRPEAVKIQFKAIAGATGENIAEEYAVRFLVTTSLGQVNYDIVRFIIQEGGCC
jgi:hypothetical protein